MRVLAEQALRVFLAILRKNSLSLPNTQSLDRRSMTYSKITCTIEVYCYNITVYVSTITLLVKVIIGLRVSAIDWSSSGLFLSIVSQDAMHTLGSHRVYIRGIRQIECG